LKLPFTALVLWISRPGDSDRSQLPYPGGACVAPFSMIILKRTSHDLQFRRKQQGSSFGACHHITLYHSVQLSARSYLSGARTPVVLQVPSVSGKGLTINATNRLHSNSILCSDPPTVRLELKRPYHFINLRRHCACDRSEQRESNYTPVFPFSFTAL
jgi:hypothetical protein